MQPTYMPISNVFESQLRTVRCQNIWRAARAQESPSGANARPITAACGDRTGRRFAKTISAIPAAENANVADVASLVAQSLSLLDDQSDRPIAR
jgi:hypothetical protein